MKITQKSTIKAVANELDHPHDCDESPFALDDATQAAQDLGNLLGTLVTNATNPEYIAVLLDITGDVERIYRRLERLTQER